MSQSDLGLGHQKENTAEHRLALLIFLRPLRVFIFGDQPGQEAQSQVGSASASAHEPSSTGLMRKVGHQHHSCRATSLDAGHDKGYPGLSTEVATSYAAHVSVSQPLLMTLVQVCLRDLQGPQKHLLVRGLPLLLLLPKDPRLAWGQGIGP